MEIFKQGEAELQFEDDRKNETITLTMDPAKGRLFIMQIAFHAIIMIQKNKEALIHRFMVLQKNFYQKKLIMGNIQRITDQKGPRK